ncbi:MarR family winged helix-turn-helix transcriptional regulator [Curtobacterium ammoniigenes]|uniref:MarR family winged helix-turn-helix transcriptional regulator n=1 Tax=Curtobacterium ammoniigenes TaxID=395387 RepID=UPI0008366EBF|nr:MarR family transcriptional regulator [Curtobacterium ammoniigenes]
MTPPAHTPASPDRGEVASRLAVVVGRLSRRSRVSPGALSYGMVSALSSIVRLGPMRPGDLARAEVVTKPTMTRVLGELEQKALIRREQDPTDGRAFVVTATPAGEAAVLEARRERAGIFAELMHELDDDEIASIGGALTALERVARVGQETLTSTS